MKKKITDYLLSIALCFAFLGVFACSSEKDTPDTGTVEKLLSANIFPRWDIHLMQASIDQSFDLAQTITVFWRNNGNRYSTITCTASTTASVRVYFHIVRKLKIDYMRDACHINTTRSHICCYEDL